jgi:hypothetical protein
MLLSVVDAIVCVSHWLSAPASQERGFVWKWYANQKFYRPIECRIGHRSVLLGLSPCYAVYSDNQLVWLSCGLAPAADRRIDRTDKQKRLVHDSLSEAAATSRRQIDFSMTWLSSAGADCRCR